MARLRRLVAPGFPHHVIQRGNNRQQIFLDSSDCERFLTTLQEAAQKFALAIHAYVLMPNHVHLLVTPADDQRLSLVMQGVGRAYVRWFNARHGRTGTLWEGRYRSAVVESERYLLACMRYVEMNPVRAGIVEIPSQYRWSSHGHHIGKRIDPLISEHELFWDLGNTPFDRQAAYSRLFETALAQDELNGIRAATQSGWALGGRPFADELGRLQDRRASPKRPGRPRKLDSELSSVPDKSGASLFSK